MHPWHFVHLDEDPIDFYEGLGLGFRDDQEDVDGGIIGGASLKAADFSVIVKAASK